MTTVRSGLAPLDARIVEKVDETIIIASGKELIFLGATY